MWFSGRQPCESLATFLREAEESEKCRPHRGSAWGCPAFVFDPAAVFLVLKSRRTLGSAVPARQAAFVPYSYTARQVRGGAAVDGFRVGGGRLSGQASVGARRVAGAGHGRHDLSSPSVHPAV